MDFLEKSIGNLLGIPICDESMTSINLEEEDFILWTKDKKNYMLFSANKNSYIYLLIVKCEKKYEEKLRLILFEVCDNIEEDYGENHRREVKDVLYKSDNWSYRLENNYNIFSMLKLQKTIHFVTGRDNYGVR